MTDLDTPCLVVDADRLERNIQRMAARVREQGLALRPHAKTHKCLEIARMQLAAGATGLTVATLSEAEVFAEAGFTGLLVAYPVVPVGPKAERLRRLVATADLRVGVENPVGAAAVAAAVGSAAAASSAAAVGSAAAVDSATSGDSAAESRPVKVVLEIDSGQHRTGVLPADVVPLAARCRELGLHVDGIFTHGGHSYGGPGTPERAAADEGRSLAEAHDLLVAAGFEITLVSAGSTPTTGGVRPQQVTEERPGSYVFHDRQQVALGAATMDDVALTVAATVVAVHPDRYVVDAGSKALAMDRPAWLDGHGLVVGRGDKALGDVVARLSEHHGVVEYAGAPPAVGDVVRVVPNHVCNVVNLFDEYLVMREGRLVDRWPIVARGRNT